MDERLADLGYMAVIEEATPGTVADTPDTYLFLYEDNSQARQNLVRSKPAVGNRWATFRALQGLRSFPLDFLVQATPNTAHVLFDMLMTRGNVTGSADPFTWPFTFGNTAPKSYTIDIALGAGPEVVRYMGCQLNMVEPVFDENEMRLHATGAALHVFAGAEIASIDEATVTLKTTYDASPSRGLVTGDVVAIWDASEDTYQNLTIDSLTGTTVTFTTSPTSVVAGDMLVLRASTPSFSTTDEPFLLSRTEWRFGATAAAAVSASHEPVEIGSSLQLTHAFNNDVGEHRTGSADPVAVARRRADATVTLRKAFKDPSDQKRFLGKLDQALVIRCFSGSSHELRFTFPALHYDEQAAKPPITVDSLIYQEMPLVPVYDSSEGAPSVTVINAVDDN